MKATISIATAVTCLFFAACESKHPESAAGTTKPEATAAGPEATAAAASPVAQTGATIKATPNPVPAGSGAGTTTISWTTGDGSEGEVYVLESGQAERLFASKMPQGSGDAPWIQAGTNYEFRLYDAAHAKLLGKVVVTRAGQ
jgi:hypothetical protein